MKFTITDPFSRKPRRLAVRKPAKDAYLEVVDLDNSGTSLAKIHAQGGKIAIDVATNDPNVNLGEFKSGVKLPTSPITGKSASPDALINWKREGDQLVFSHPETGETVSLKVEPEPGPMTPREPIPPILGQQEMTFTVALALATGKHSMLIGPTGTGKTSFYRWLAKELNWNIVVCPIARGTEAAHMIGEYAPTGPATFEWMDGPVTKASRLSQDHPTLLVFDELNRIGNISEFSRLYSILDDTKTLILDERRGEGGASERIDCSQLFVGATSNPSDDDNADYVGTQDLDPALSSRFAAQPTVDYPLLNVEAKALTDRVEGLELLMATKLCLVAKQIREAEDVRFPISFRELEAWAKFIPYCGYEGAARIAVLNKAPADFRSSIAGYLKLQG